MALQHAEVNRIRCTSFLALDERVFNKVGLVVISTGSAVQKKSFQSLCIYDIHGYYSPSLTPISTASLHLSTHPSWLILSLFSFSTPSFPPFLSLSLFFFFVQRDWLLGPAPGAETLANSVALHCVGWKKRPSCEVSVRPRLINEQTGRQSGPSLVFLSWINEAFLKDTPHCSSHWSNIPQHLTLPNFL